jgi:transcriptional regulator with XRE-family HTH domain
MMSEYDRQLGARIAQSRAMANLTQAELGDRMGLGRSSIANIERGRQRILAATLMELSQALYIDPRWLLTGGTYTPPRRQVTRMSRADRGQIRRGMSMLKSVATVLERLAGEE